MNKTPDPKPPEFEGPDLEGSAAEAAGGPALIDVEAELVDNDPPPGDGPSAKPDASARPKSSPVSLPGRATPMLLAAFLVIIVVAAGVFFAKKQLRKEDAAETVETDTETPPAPVIIEPPTADVGTPLAGDGPAPDKIFNTANDAMKAGADAIARTVPSEPGTISKLPPPPAATGGNEALQDAAKDAAKQLSPKPAPPAEIDLSSPDAEAALEQLQHAASSPDAAVETGASAPSNSAPEIARLTESLEAKTRQADVQAAEIARLNADLARLQASVGPLAEKARTALIFDALAEKARSGAPYRRELDAFKARAGASLSLDAIEGAADSGLNTLAALKSAFPEARNAALAAARRDAAKGAMSRLAANLASLVNLRPATPREGNSAVAVLSRAEAKLDADDLSGAVGELAALSGEPREAMAYWMVKAERRRDAESALAAINGALLAEIQGERAY